ncbi:MAG: hypothetical protein IJJ47_08265 [Methanosphaera sp.]|nr:hypothetical protein [Methanosphaera sp.]
MDLYIEYTHNLARSFFSKTNKNKDSFSYWVKKRRDLINKAPHKYDFLIEFLKENEDIKDTIIYCSENKQVQKVQKILNEFGIRNHEFTGKTSHSKDKDNTSQRDKILKEFESGFYNVLVAIKCLDEGVDIPSAKNVILMASTTNTRQHIQRRGRILRKSPGKSIANIYDLIVFPEVNFNDSMFNSILFNEMRRYDEYAYLAENSTECSKTIIKKMRRL